MTQERFPLELQPHSYFSATPARNSEINDMLPLESESINSILFIVGAYCDFNEVEDVLRLVCTSIEDYSLGEGLVKWNDTESRPQSQSLLVFMLEIHKEERTFSNELCILSLGGIVPNVIKAGVSLYVFPLIVKHSIVYLIFF